MYSNGMTGLRARRRGLKVIFFLAKLKPQLRGKGNIVKHGVRMVKEHIRGRSLQANRSVMPADVVIASAGRTGGLS